MNTILHSSMVDKALYVKLISHGIIGYHSCSFCGARHHTINSPKHLTERFSANDETGAIVELYICKTCYLAIPKASILIGTRVEAWQKEEREQRQKV